MGVLLGARPEWADLAKKSDLHGQASIFIGAQWIFGPAMGNSA